MQLLYFLMLLAGIVQLVSAQGSNTITVPPNGFEVVAGEFITIEWTNPSLRTVTIQLAPASSSSSIITLGSTLPNNGSATLYIPSNIPTTQEYQFRIVDDSNSSNVGFSPAFAIAPPASTLSSGTSSTGTTPQSTSSDPSSSSTDSSLSTSAIAGISVGSVLGLAILITLASFFLYRHHRHKKWTQQQQQQQQQQSSISTHDTHNPSYNPNYRPEPVHLESMTKNAGDGRAEHEVSEVSGSRSWPREMEAMSRFQQSEVAELPASPVDTGTRKEKR